LLRSRLVARFHSIAKGIFALSKPFWPTNAAVEATGVPSILAPNDRWGDMIAPERTSGTN